MSKETFKLFARNHPELAKYVLNQETTWQKLYELYEIYGEDNSIWKDYLEVSNNLTSPKPASFNDLINIIKNIDLDSVQKGVTNLQKTIGLLQDIGIGTTSNSKNDSYETRPLYQYFED